MTATNRPPMTGGEFDRDAVTRRSDAALDGAWNETAARLLHLRQGSVLVRRNEDGTPRLELTPTRGARAERHLYLGRMLGQPVFAEVEDEFERETDIIDIDATAVAERGRAAAWESPFACAAELDTTEAEALAAALALSAWHASMGFSPRDGSPTVPTQGGWVQLDAHGREHFPRTDPVVIVLIEHEGRLLLGSNALWEPDRFSLLAGFVEAGESAEQAVVREVYEESGMRLTDIRYVTSQPWPFPRSFMMGFRARLAEGEDPHALTPDPEEISELRWFTAEDLRHPGSLILPRSLSIARWLIDAWLVEQAEQDTQRPAPEAREAAESEEDNAGA